MAMRHALLTTALILLVTITLERHAQPKPMDTADRGRRLLGGGELKRPVVSTQPSTAPLKYYGTAYGWAYYSAYGHLIYSLSSGYVAAKDIEDGNKGKKHHPLPKLFGA